MAAHSHSPAKLHATTTSSSTVMHMPKITVTSTERNGIKCGTTTTKTIAEPKSPDCLTAAMPRKSLTSMSDGEIIQENLKELMDMKSREERKANGRLVAVIVAFLVIFMAVYHAWKNKPAPLAGVLVPAGIMLSYGAWVVVLAKRDKRNRAIFERHIEEVAQKNKTELKERHARLKLAHLDDHSGSSCSGSLKYVNELAPNGEHHKKHKHHRQRQHKSNDQAGSSLLAEVKVHRSVAKRPSFRQKLFGQTIAHVKLLEMQSDGPDFKDTDAPKPAIADKVEDKHETIAMPKMKRMDSAP